MNRSPLLWNQSKIFTLVLGLVGGPLAASAAVETFNAYNLVANWTNAEAVVWSVRGAPRTLSGTFPQVTQSTTLQTDGAGKITGTGSWEWIYDGTDFPFSNFTVDISGKISSTATKPLAVVTMNVKGTGYTVDSNGVTTLTSLNLKFKGGPGPDPSNTNRTRIVGVLNGTIHGPTPLGAKSAKIQDLVAYVSNSSSNTADISLDMVQSAKRMLIEQDGLGGQGSINTRSNTFKLNVHGTGANRGESLALSGALGSYTNTLGTNDVAFSAPVSVKAKGKISGQAVSGTTEDVNASLIQP